MNCHTVRSFGAGRQRKRSNQVETVAAYDEHR